MIPGAAVEILNVDTKVSQNLVTNGSGYFEARLLNPGNYEVTVRVQDSSPRCRATSCLPSAST